MRLFKNVLGPLINAMESTGAQQPGKAFTIEFLGFASSMRSYRPHGITVQPIVRFWATS